MDIFDVFHHCQISLQMALNHFFFYIVKILNVMDFNFCLSKNYTMVLPYWFNSHFLITTSRMECSPPCHPAVYWPIGLPFSFYAYNVQTNEVPLSRSPRALLKICREALGPAFSEGGPQRHHFSRVASQAIWSQLLKSLYNKPCPPNCHSTNTAVRF